MLSEQRRVLSERLGAPVDASSVAIVRIAVGGLVAIEAAAYLLGGELRKSFLDPEFHFGYWPLEWIQPLPEPWLQVVFVGLAAVALLVAAGALYRLAAPLMALGFAYLFLLDKTEYLNHFYAVVLFALLLVVIPADRALSVRSRRRGAPAAIRAWSVWLLRFQVGVIYLYGGVAKLNSDWLAGEPMGIWLAAREDLALVGPLLAEPAAAQALTWGGLAFDLLIVPALLWRRSRPWAYGAAVAFHLANAVIWDIGIFPWLMIGATTIFFAPDWPRRAAARLGARVPAPPRPQQPPAGRLRRVGLAALGLYLALQLLVPLRHHLYPGDVGWTEEGHRFAWHMKLRDKRGATRFFAVDPGSGERRALDLSGLVTERQRRRMAGRPDMIRQLARHLAERERRRGRRVEIRVDARASLNGRPLQRLVDPDRDLGSEPAGLGAKGWILPQRLSLRAASPTG